MQNVEILAQKPIGEVGYAVKNSPPRKTLINGGLNCRLPYIALASQMEVMYDDKGKPSSCHSMNLIVNSFPIVHVVLISMLNGSEIVYAVC